MKFPDELDRIKVSQKDKDALIMLKRRTGIPNWNTLCRWAFCLSLAEPKAPKAAGASLVDSNIEMNWKTFGGEHPQLLFHLLVERCLADGIAASPENIALQFKLHLHRGIGYLSVKGKIRSVVSLADMAITARPGEANAAI